VVLGTYIILILNFMILLQYVLTIFIYTVELSRSDFYPVYSSFNGLSIMKYSFIGDCKHDGKNYELQHYTGEDCEHVPFYKCIGRQNNGKVRLYKHYLLQFNAAA
jgi:hypothetical protein